MVLITNDLVSTFYVLGLILALIIIMSLVSTHYKRISKQLAVTDYAQSCVFTFTRSLNYFSIKVT